MRVLTETFEFNNQETIGKKRKLNYVWIGKRKKGLDSTYAGTIDTREQANKLIKMLKETKFE